MLLAVVLPARLDARTMAERMHAACRLDIERICPDADADQLKACMTARRQEVSTACMMLIDASE